MNCLNSFRTGNKFTSHEKACKIKDFCEIVMPSEKNKTLKFNQYMNTDTIYADLECLIKKICGCVNNPAKSLTTKIGENIPCG